jgi:tetratricopeptide (TPR) repeat protein
MTPCGLPVLLKRDQKSARQAIERLGGCAAVLRSLLQIALLGAVVGGAQWRSVVLAQETSRAVLPRAGAGQTAPVAPQSAVDSRLDSDEKLDAYLAKLGLNTLRVLHTEQRLQQAGPQQRVRLARQLADLYVQELVASTDDAARFEDLLGRVQRLLQSAPEARTPGLEVVLLQAEYERAERLIARWLSDPAASAARQEAESILRRITVELETAYKRLDSDVQALLERADAQTDLAETDSRLLQTQAMAARAGYFTAWSCFYWGALRGDSGRQDVSKARLLFRRLLDLEEEEDLGRVDPLTLGMESPWRARAAIGLALAEAHLQHLDAAGTCLDWVRRQGPMQLRDQVDSWHVQALMWARQWDVLLALAQDRIAALPAEPSEGRVLLCATLVRAAHFPLEKPPAAVAQKLVQLALSGLARMKQYNALRELTSRYAITIDRPTDFWQGWLLAQQKRAAAAGQSDPAVWKEVAEAYAQAMAFPDAGQDRTAAARCRHEWAWCLFQAGQWEAARQQYQRAAEQLQAVSDPDAVQAAWMAVVSIQRIVPATQRQYEDTEALVQWMQRFYPGHELTRRAELLRKKMQWQSLPLAERLEALRSVPPNDPGYVLAAVELCQLLYGQWQSATGEQKATVAIELQQAALALLERAGSELTADQRRSVRLNLADVAIAQSAWQDAARHLAAAEEGLAAAEPAQQARWHYYALLVARGQAQPESVVQHSQWFLDHGKASAYELAALSVAVNLLDQGENPPRQLLYAMYRRLVELLGPDPSSWATNRNARVAASKLAQLAWQLGYHNEAITWYDALVRAMPKERAYWRALGLLTFETRQWQRSLECWRTLLAGSPLGSDAWYEAKYYQLLCLLETDRAVARQVWKEFEIVDPQRGTGQWQEKFRQLADRLR